MNIYDTREGARLTMNRERKGHWNRWGPYLAERAWGTVREDYSADGDAWGYFPHDHARSRAYRWNEDGLGGICDRHQHLCFALALWNGRDPILKERMFGLSGPEGNHGEDVKEYYFYLDSTPTHSYMKFLYKYPQGEFPYARLVEENGRRGQDAAGVRAGRHGDLRRRPLLRRRRRVRQGQGRRHPDPDQRQQPRPGGGAAGPPADALVSEHVELGARPAPPGDHGARGRHARRHALEPRRVRAALLRRRRTAVHRERNQHRAAVRRPVIDPLRQGRLPRVRRERPARGGQPCRHGHEGRARATPEPSAPARRSSSQLRLAPVGVRRPLRAPFAQFDATFERRRKEADEFYAVVLPAGLSDDARIVARQAFAGMLWSKQYYHYVVGDWMDGDPALPQSAGRTPRRPQSRSGHICSRGM